MRVMNTGAMTCHPGRGDTQYWLRLPRAKPKLEARPITEPSFTAARGKRAVGRLWSVVSWVRKAHVNCGRSVR
jgi:hypothetical protein